MKRPSSGLTTQVLLVLALASIVPTVLVGVLAIRRARADLEREVVRGNLALIRALGASVDGTLQDARRALELASFSWADSRTTASQGDADRRAATTRLLRRLRREVPLFATLSIVDVNGTLLHGDTVTVRGGLGAHTFGGYIGDVKFDKGRPRVRVVAQARSRTGELVGAFIAHLDLQFISDALAQARLGPGARLLVVDGDGIPVARSSGRTVAGAPSLRGTNPAVDRALGSAVEGNLESGGVVAVYRNLSSYQSQRGVRWAIVLEQPTRDAYALARKTTRDTILAGLVVLAFALVVGFVLATRLTRPLHALTERADAIAGEGGIPESAPPAPLDAPGEIGLLARRFEDMARRIGEREQLQQALARGDRLSTVGTMAASVAHEINNPLTTVLGYAKLLAEDKDEDHPDRAGLELIADEAARMKTIVGSLLDYSRSGKGAAQAGAADVNGLLEKTAALLLPAMRRARVRIEFELADGLPPASADDYSLQQIFVNLAQNAAQAMTNGGLLHIASHPTTRGVGTGRAIEISFTDEGPGVRAEDRERIFDAFYTTKEASMGTGLGLAVCKHLASALGGSIDVCEPAAGTGACFRVVLPAQDTV